MTKDEKKKILLISLYVLGILILGIIAYQIQQKRRSEPTESKYYDTQDSKSTTDDLTGYLNIQLEKDINIPESLPVYQKDDYSNFQIPENLKLTLTSELTGYKKWESSEWIYIEEESVDNRLSSKVDYPETTSGNLRTTELEEIAWNFIEDVLKLDYEKTDFSIKAKVTYNLYQVSFYKRINSLNVVKGDELVDVFNISIAENKEVVFVEITNPEILTARIINNVQLLTLQELQKLSTIDVIKRGDAYIFIVADPETEHGYSHATPISEELKRTLITEVEIAYQIKVSQEENLLLPVFVLRGTGESKTGYSGDVTIIYPAAR